MSSKSTIILALVFAALAAYIYRYEWEPMEEESNPDREAIFEFDAEKIQSIEIRRQEGEHLKIERQGEGSWQLVAPVDVAADSSASDSLAESIATLESQRLISVGEANLADFGLDTPKFELEVVVKDAEDVETSTTLHIGDETPTGSNLYAHLADGEKIFVIASSKEYSLNKKAWDLRDRSLFRFKRDDVEKVILKQPDQELVLAKAGEDSWNIVEPTFSRADRYKAGGLVSKLETAKMVEIVSESAEELSEYGLDSPSYEVEVQLEGGLTETLLVGKEKDSRYYATNPDRPMVYLIESSLVDDIKKGHSEYVSKRLFDFATYQVNKLKISSPEGPDRIVEKSKQDEQDVWTETAPEPRELDRTKVEDLLYKLSGNQAEETLTDRPGSSPPDYTITVWSKDSEQVEEITVVKSEDDAVYARRKGDDLVLKLNPSSWEEIEKLMVLEEAEEKDGPEEPDEKDESDQ
jgi:hypothetical protein